MKKYNFNVDTSGLTAYVDENDTQLMYQLQMESELVPYAEVRSGIKGTERMHFMTTTATFQTDACSYNASDTTTFTEKDILQLWKMFARSCYKGSGRSKF
jgi:hypothetical protein